MSKRFFGNSAARDQSASNIKQKALDDEQFSALYALGIIESSERGPRRRDNSKARDLSDETSSYPQKSEFSCLLYLVSIWVSKLDCPEFQEFPRGYCLKY